MISGRRGFNHFRDNVSITKGTKPELIAMLKKENEYFAQNMRYLIKPYELFDFCQAQQK